MPTLEIAITDTHSAIVAQQGGADSVELSIDLQRDGLTPPLYLIKSVRTAVSIPVHVIIRPHDRDFVYLPNEVALILRQAREIAATGVDGIVFGAHLPDGSMDTDLISRVRETAPNLQFTLHRALDTCVAPESALKVLGNTINRALTSGPAATAWEGREDLYDWVRKFDAKIDFIAAGSITLEQLPELITSTNVSGVHCGSAARVNGEVNVEAVRLLKAALKTE